MAVNLPSSSSLEKLLESLETNIDYICDENSTKKPRGRLKSCLVSIKVCAQAVGLSHEHILQLVDITASQRYGFQISSDLIRCCIPQTTFPQNAAIKLLSCVNSLIISGVNTSFMQLVFRWIVLVIPYMDAHDNLHAVYNVFFYLLRNYHFLPEICYILNYLTLYHHVTLFRINELLLLWRKTGNVPPLIGLLVKYKMLRPDKLGLSLPKYQCFFRQPDTKMQKIIQAVQQRRGLGLNNLVHKSAKSPVSKKAKLSKLIPHVQSSINEFIPTTEGISSGSFPQTVSFHRILTFKDLLQYVDQIQLPIQIGAVIDNPLLQYLITYNKNQHLTGQFNWWLYHTCYDAFLETSVQYSDYLEEFLSKLAGFMRRVKEGTPAIEYFLCQFLDTWDGFEFNQSIFKLIPHFRIHTFSELHRILLDPLKKIFFRRGIYVKCRILITLTELVTNYINKWQHLHMLRKMKVSKTAITTEHEFSFFQGDFYNFQAHIEFKKLIDFVDELCLLGLLCEDDHLLMVHFCLWFQEQMLTSILKTDFPLLTIASPEFISRLIVSKQSTVISRLCRIIFDYSCVFQNLKKLQIPYKLDEPIKQLNIYVLDVCNALWCYKAFITTEQNSDSTLFDFDIISVPGIRSKSVNSSLSLLHHQAFLGHAQLFLKKKMPNSRQHPSMIRKNRKNYFQFLRDQKLEGLTDFISRFIDSRLDLQTETV